MSIKLTTCPNCDAQLTAGFLGEKGYLRWYETLPRRVTLMNLGFALMKFRTWGYWLGATPSLHCKECRLTMFQSDNSPAIDNQMKPRSGATSKSEGKQISI